MWSRFLAILALVAVPAFCFNSSVASAQSDKTIDILKIGTTAPDVDFQPLGGEARVKLSDLTSDGPVVLVVLRGYPGYQCPICSRQVRDLISHADQFESLGAKVVLVYPGPADNLAQRATEFLRGTELPHNFLFMIDPDYAFTNLYDLRWDATKETAYPSTFVLDEDRVVKFRTISTSHGGRANTSDVIAAVEQVAGANAN